MEPERKIEKLLRACAKKRRADAGQAFKLHPATRRLLQAEVARNTPKPNAARDRLWWQLFSAGPASTAGMLAATAFIILVFLGAAFLLPALGRAKSKAQTLGAMSNLKQIGVAAKMYAGDNRGRLPVSLDAVQALAGTNALVDPLSGKPFIYIGGGREMAGLNSNSVLAYSPAESKTHAVLFADGQVQAMNVEKFSELTNRGLLLLAAADEKLSDRLAATPAAAPMLAANEPAQKRALAARTRRAPETSTNQLAGPVQNGTVTVAGAAPAPATPPDGSLMNREISSLDKVLPQSNTGSPGVFAFQAANGSLQMAVAQNAFKNSAAPAKAPRVLENFQLQQSGDSLSVVDEDGSIYQGSWQPGGDFVAATESSLAKAPGAIPAQHEAGKDLPAAQNRGQTRSQPAQNYFFRVTGTNRSLGQNVVFTGNLLALTNGAQNGPAGFGGFGGRASNAGQLGIFQNSRIAGTAVINFTNAIKIDALPATQMMNSTQRQQ